MTPEDRQAIERQESNPTHLCAECGAAVVVFNENVFKTCEHADAQIVLNPAALKGGA